MKQPVFIKTDATDVVMPPQQIVADTRENRVKAMMEFAWAYHRKNPYVQYDITNMSILGRKGGCRTGYRMANTPEMAGPWRNIYAHCCFYAYCCVFHAFDHEMMGSWLDCFGSPLATKHPLVAPYTVFQHSNTGDEEVDNAAMVKFFETLQEGDVICYTRKKTITPHIVIWAGDTNGDGVGDIVNVCGTPYNVEQQKELRDNYGAVWVNTIRWDCKSGVDYFSNPEKSYDYFTKLKDVSILRYTDEKHAANAPLTERAKTRILYPGLDIRYEVEGGLYGCVKKGEELTYTLTLTNHSRQNHWGIQVQLPRPRFSEVVKVNGYPVENASVRRIVNIPAGSKEVITVTVKAWGDVGNIVDSGTGYVHAIPLPTYTTAIVSEKAKTAEVKAAIQSAKDKSGEAFLKAYLTAMKQKTVPTLSQLQAELFDAVTVDEYALMQPKERNEAKKVNKSLAEMQIPYYFGGQYVVTEGTNLRVKELRSCDLLPGDIFLWQENEGDKAFVCVHDGKALTYAKDGKLIALTQEDLDKVIRYRFFIALRPTQTL